MNLRGRRGRLPVLRVRALPDSGDGQTLFLSLFVHHSLFCRHLLSRHNDKRDQRAGLAGVRPVLREQHGWMAAVDDDEDYQLQLDVFLLYCRVYRVGLTGVGVADEVFPAAHGPQPQEFYCLPT